MDRELLLVAFMFALVNSLMGLALASRFDQWARKLGEFLQRLSRPYDYTRDYYFDREFAKKTKAETAQ